MTVISAAMWRLLFRKIGSVGFVGVEVAQQGVPAVTFGFGVDGGLVE